MKFREVPLTALLGGGQQQQQRDHGAQVSQQELDREMAARWRMEVGAWRPCARA